MAQHPVLRLLVPLGAFLLLAGCIVTSENPVAPPGEPARDPALRGAWAAEGGREVLHIMSLKDDTEAGFDGLYVVHDKNNTEGEDGWMRLRVLAHTVDGKPIMSVRILDRQGEADGDDIKGWLIMLYQVKDNVLELRMIREEPVEEAIKAGTLPGKLGDDPHVTATWDQWRKFLSTADTTTLFEKDPGRMHRVNVPEEEDAN